MIDVSTNIEDIPDDAEVYRVRTVHDGANMRFTKWVLATSKAQAKNYVLRQYDGHRVVETKAREPPDDATVHDARRGQ